MQHKSNTKFRKKLSDDALRGYQCPGGKHTKMSNYLAEVKSMLSSRSTESLPEPAFPCNPLLCVEWLLKSRRVGLPQTLLVAWSQYVILQLAKTGPRDLWNAILI